MSNAHNHIWVVVYGWYSTESFTFKIFTNACGKRFESCIQVIIGDFRIMTKINEALTARDKRRSHWRWDRKWQIQWQIGPQKTKPVYGITMDMQQKLDNQWTRITNSGPRGPGNRGTLKIIWKEKKKSFEWNSSKLQCHGGKNGPCWWRSVPLWSEIGDHPKHCEDNVHTK